MKVIAIQDAPNIDTTISWAKQFNIERAYQKGDIFEVRERIHETHKKYKNGLVIFNNYINKPMEVNPDNFITLDDYRNIKINQIIE
jgi:hypothetical protein